MEVIIVFSVIIIGLFISAFITKRRFGLLGLALAAGSILSNIWADDAGLVAGLFGIRQSVFTTAAILVFIIILPSMVLLFHGSTYKNIIGRIVGAGLFTMLAFAFILEPLGRMLVLSGSGGEIYNFLIQQHNTVIGVGLILAVVDLFLTKPNLNLPEKHRKH